MDYYVIAFDYLMNADEICLRCGLKLLPHTLAHMRGELRPPHYFESGGAFLN